MDDLVERINMVDVTMNPMTLVIVAREAADELIKLKSRNEDLEYTAEQDLRRLKEQNKYIEELLNVIRYVEPILVTNAMIEPRDKRTKRTLHLVQSVVH
jgi:hypothetical protein